MNTTSKKSKRKRTGVIATAESIIAPGHEALIGVLETVLDRLNAIETKIDAINTVANLCKRSMVVEQFNASEGAASFLGLPNCHVHNVYRTPGMHFSDQSDVVIKVFVSHTEQFTFADAGYACVEALMSTPAFAAMFPTASIPKNVLLTEFPDVARRTPYPTLNHLALEHTMQQRCPGLITVAPARSGGIYLVLKGQMYTKWMVCVKVLAQLLGRTEDDVRFVTLMRGVDIPDIAYKCLLCRDPERGADVLIASLGLGGAFEAVSEIEVARGAQDPAQEWMDSIGANELVHRVDQLCVVGVP